jgi:hypothetical protein
MRYLRSKVKWHIQTLVPTEGAFTQIADVAARPSESSPMDV